MTTPTVFISYSHKDEEWKERLVTQLNVLQMEDILDVWDDSRIVGGDDWQPEIEKAMDAASVAILMVSADFLTSKFIRSKEVPPLLQRRLEEGLTVFPILVRPCPWKRVDWLARIQMRPKGRALSAGDDHQIDSDLAAIAEEVADIVGRATQITTTNGAATLAPEKISLARLPSTSPDLFGRDEELAILDGAWTNPKTNVISLVAFGGVGKTALINRWLLQMGADNYRGAQRAYGWSFYSQGAAEGRQASADLFIATALRDFGDPNPDDGSPWDKGERLADLVRRQRTLLVMDGMEPLQQPPAQAVQEGRLKDPGLQALLRELARHNPGLCVVSTRLEVDDLKEFEGTSYESIDLEDLSPEAGIQLLKSLGVKGTPDELKEAVDEYEGHALALTLLGRYLATVYDGDIRQRDKIAALTREKRQGEHARRVMDSYPEWFTGKPELDILHIMGLFDRPVEEAALEALLSKRAIKGLTTKLKKMSQED